MEIICNHEYKEEMEKLLNAKKKEILDFFKLEDVDTKIMVWDDKKAYKSNLLRLVKTSPSKKLEINS